MRIKRSLISGVLLVSITISIVIFYILSEKAKYEIDELPEVGSELEQWKIEDSVLNGVPLVENKNVYLGQEPGEITKVYITIFPTKDKEGKILDFSSFGLHKALDKTYNPILNCNVQLVNEKDNIATNKNLDIVNGTIRVRGNSSRGALLKSYNIKLKEDAGTFYGQSVLNINKHTGDISKISNKFSYDMMSQLKDMVSLRTNFMIVYIRDASLPLDDQKFVYQGLYTHVEQPNKNFLRTHGLDENGTLYKATGFEFRLKPELKNIDDPTYSKKEFEKVLNIREGNDHSKLLKMLEEINDINLDFEEAFPKYFNEDNYITWMACNILLGNEDTIAHNFMLYNPKHSLTWYFIPWDYDKTFRFGVHDKNTIPISLKGIQRHTGVLLHRRYLRQEGNVTKLTNKIEELLRTTFAKENVNNYLRQYKPVLGKTMMLEPDILVSKLAPNEYNDYIDQFYDYMQSNYRIFLESLEYPNPIFVSEPLKTDKGTYFTWETSYDFQGDLLTYDVTLARNYELTDIVFQKKGFINNNYLYTKDIPEGTYYLAVTVTDRSGNQQISLDYISEGVYIYGVREVKIK